MERLDDTTMEAQTLRSALATALSAFRRSALIRLGALVGIALIAILLVRMLVGPVDDGTFPKVVTVPQGASLREAALTLAEANVINAPIVFKDLVIVLDGEAALQAGDYFFEEPVSALTAALRFTRGDSRLTPVLVTIPEGTDIYGIADILAKSLTMFDKDGFLEAAKDREGYLFPDTYHFPQGGDPDDIIDIMEQNFERKLEPLMEDIRRFGRPLSEVIIMASILEGEARTTESRQMVAGILWKRISINMPLQVDAAFKYVNGKTTFGLTTEDLRTDHPYNTYTNTGLPPGPINNPGLDAIRSTISPTVSPYLYYLTDRKGNMRYAKTHDEHVTNKQVYLR